MEHPVVAKRERRLAQRVDRLVAGGGERAEVAEAAAMGDRQHRHPGGRIVGPLVEYQRQIRLTGFLDPGGDPGPAARKAAGNLGGGSGAAIFVPVGGQALPQLLAGLSAGQTGGVRAQIVGTGIWGKYVAEERLEQEKSAPQSVETQPPAKESEDKALSQAVKIITNTQINTPAKPATQVLKALPLSEQELHALSTKKERSDVLPQ